MSGHKPWHTLAEFGLAIACALIGHDIPMTEIGRVGYDSHRRCRRCHELIARRRWPRAARLMGDGKELP